MLGREGKVNGNGHEAQEEQEEEVRKKVSRRRKRKRRTIALVKQTEIKMFEWRPMCVSPGWCTIHILY